MSADGTPGTPPTSPSPPGPPPPPAPPSGAQQRPEILAGAAFAGGLVAALLLRRLRGRD